MHIRDYGWWGVVPNCTDGYLVTTGQRFVAVVKKIDGRWSWRGMGVHRTEDYTGSYSTLKEASYAAAVATGELQKNHTSEEN